jgi:hypothetical protein
LNFVSPGIPGFEGVGEVLNNSKMLTDVSWPRNIKKMFKKLDKSWMHRICVDNLFYLLSCNKICKSIVKKLKYTDTSTHRVYMVHHLQWREMWTKMLYHWNNFIATFWWCCPEHNAVSILFRRLNSCLSIKNWPLTVLHHI